MTASLPDEPLEAAAKALLDEGGGPGNSIHSWRCEYPDRYGDCDCVVEAAKAVVSAYLAAGPEPEYHWGVQLNGYAVYLCADEAEARSRLEAERDWDPAWDLVRWTVGSFVEVVPVETAEAQTP